MKSGITYKIRQKHLKSLSWPSHPQKPCLHSFACVLAWLKRQLEVIMKMLETYLLRRKGGDLQSSLRRHTMKSCHLSPWCCDQKSQ